MSLKTTNEIQGIARLKIHDCKLEEFKRVASQARKWFERKIPERSMSCISRKIRLSALSLKGIVTHSLYWSITII